MLARWFEIERRWEAEGWRLNGHTAFLLDQLGAFVQVKITNARNAGPRLKGGWLSGGTPSGLATRDLRGGHGRRPCRSPVFHQRTVRSLCRRRQAESGGASPFVKAIWSREIGSGRMKSFGQPCEHVMRVCVKRRAHPATMSSVDTCRCLISPTMRQSDSDGSAYLSWDPG